MCTICIFVLFKVLVFACDQRGNFNGYGPEGED
jgi:hypothetical protein